MRTVARRAAWLVALSALPAFAQTTPPSRPGGLGAAPPTTEAEPQPIQPGVSQGGGNAVSASRALLRVLDKVDGSLTDLDLAAGETAEVGTIAVTLGDCRYPVGNPNGDAFALLQVRTLRDDVAVFEGWMVASSPALNALDHPRYDVWVLRCAGI